MNEHDLRWAESLRGNITPAERRALISLVDEAIKEYYRARRRVIGIFLIATFIWTFFWAL
jgi:hypothetical protein